MTNDELIEREAEELFVIQRLRGVGPLVREWSEKVARVEWRAKIDFVKQTWRDEARSLNHLLNECGVRMTDNQKFPEYEADESPHGELQFAWLAGYEQAGEDAPDFDWCHCELLPEAKEGK
jgi:hypothetical protein